MPVELIVIVALVVMFVGSILLNLNMGLAAFVTAFVVAVYIAGMSAKEVFAGFPANMFINLFGITFLLGIAHENKTMDWLVTKFIGLTRGRLALLPWVFFAVSAITATLGPAVAPLMIGMALTLAEKYKINPLLAGAMVVHGSQGGSFSPIAPFGVLINSLVESSGLTPSPYLLYTQVLLAHVLLAAIIFVFFGGIKLVGQKAVNIDLPSADMAGPEKLQPGQIATLAGILLLVVAVVLHIHIGIAALAIGLVLLLFLPRGERQRSLTKMPWGVIVIISGVLTYVSVMQSAGAISWLGEHINNLGSPLWIALLMCFLVAIITAFASTFGTIGILIPLSVPFLLSGEISTAGLVGAMVISAVMTDISPFSTYGALVLASAREEIRERLMSRMLVYMGVLVVLAPIVSWLVLVVPGW